MQRWPIVLVAFAGALAARPAQGAFHLWDVSEVFTNGDGSVQFIELATGDTALDNGQNFLAGHHLEVFETGVGVALATYEFTSDLPSNQTRNKHFLLATSGFCAEPEVAPDYEIPAGFIDAARADFLDFADGFDIFQLAGLPTDGSNSLVDGGGTGPPTPTNFAGDVCTTLPEPAAAASLAAGALLALARVARPRR